MIHYLKCWPEFFKEVLDGNKTFELRLDDRGFKVGDILVLEEYDPKEKKFSGHALSVKVTYLVSGLPALRSGYVAMSVKEV